MKIKTFLGNFLAAVLLISSTTVAHADPINEAAARKIATAFCAENSNQSEVTLVKRAARSEAKARRLSSSTQVTSPYYIYSRGEDQGFVIVAGDDCLPEILGYTESGNWDEASQVPALQGWLQMYADLIENVQASGQSVSRKTTARRAAATATAKQDIDILLTSHWHQSWPYNNHCPTITGTSNLAATGCVATAATQVGYYFRKDMPDELQSSTPTYEYGDAPVTRSVPKGTPLKWGIMLDNYNESHPSEYDDAVAEYVFAMGAACWMTYGSSSGAQTPEVVNAYSNYFDMDSKNLWKSTTTQTAWENLIYKDLQEGRPIVYAGYTENNEGHCIVLDGYRTSGNLFHFNFGWGGQGDGWYTVDDVTGVNGYGTNQDMVYNITPRKQNLSATLSINSGFYVYHDNPITVTITNNGTLDYSGVYLFLSTSNSKPTALSSAKVSDTESVLPNDGSVSTFTYELRPSSEREYYLFLTDNKLNVLAQQKVEAVNSENQLSVQSIQTAGSTNTQDVNGEKFAQVNGTQALVIVHVENTSSVSYEDSPRLTLYGSTDGGSSFSLVGTKYADRVKIPSGESGDIYFSISSTSTCPIDTNVLYRAVLKNPLSTHSDAQITYAEGVDSITRFILHATQEELSATLHGDTLVFSGLWNANTYRTICSRTSNAAANIYDLTAVREVGIVPQGIGNALAYIGEDAVLNSGINIVDLSTASAEHLVLSMDYNFHPLTTFTAKECEITLKGEPNQWFLFTAPFTAELPTGVVAKEIQSHSTSGISKKATLVRTLEVGKTYMLMLSSSRTKTLSASNVTIQPLPAVNVDTAVVGTFVTTTAPAGAYEIGEGDTQYFVSTQEVFSVSPFSGWFYDSKMSNQFRANSEIALDPAYLEVGQAIAYGYETLDEYASILSSAAQQLLTDSLSLAEQHFALRDFADRTTALHYADSLLALVDACKTQLKPVLDAETDMTGCIRNPSFEEKVTSSASVGSTVGWTAESSSVRVVLNSNVTYRGVGADGDNILYSCVGDSMGYGISQTITGILPGLYRLTAKVACAEDDSVTLYANDNITIAYPHPFGIYYLNEASVDSIIVTATDPTLTIGVKEGGWYKADDFRLTYLRGLTPEEDPVAIEDIHTGLSNADSLRPDAIYDLTGRRLQAAPSHGLYIEIKNGVVTKRFCR